MLEKGTPSVLQDIHYNVSCIGTEHVCMFRGVPDSKFHGANVGPIWGRQDPGGPHVGPMNLAIWG